MGLAVAAPVGPIGLLCIRRTLNQGRSIGLASGFGAATADATYGMIAAFGLTTLSNFLSVNTTYIQWFGGLFLCYLGLKIFCAKSVSYRTNANEKALSSEPTLTTISTQSTLFAAYSTTLALTLTNPATILSFLAIFARLGIMQTDYLQSITLVFSVFSGSQTWWLMLVSGVAYLRERLTPRRLNKLNALSSKACGLLIVAFGVAAFLSL